MNAHIEPPKLPAWIESEFPFRRRVMSIDNRRIHFVDEGDGLVVLMVHGNPTWSYLWRKMIRLLLPFGVRVVAPDLLGFGFSDKLSHPSEHTMETHVAAIQGLVEELDLERVVIVGQDWGGPIAAGVAARCPQRVVGAAFGNTALLLPKDPIRTTWFHRVSHVPILSEALFIGLGFPVSILHRVQGDPASIDRNVKRAYALPFLRRRDRSGPLGLARMVPNTQSHPSMPVLAEVDAWTRAFRGPAALVWGLRDPILGRALKRLREALPQARVSETQAGHFLQEEVPDVLAQAILDVVKELTS